MTGLFYTTKKLTLDVIIYHCSTRAGQYKNFRSQLKMQKFENEIIDSPNQ